MKEIDDIAIRLMARIMHEGMHGYRIAELLNEANKKFHFYKGKFKPPGDTGERKENYAYRWLAALKEKEWENALYYISERLIDESRVYFSEDAERPYPEEKIESLKKKLTSVPKKEKKQKKKPAGVERIHGRRLNKLLSTIADEDLRECITSDIRDIENCIHAAAWKPAVIMCGSVLEAILTDWLNQLPEADVKEAYLEVYPSRKNAKKVEKFKLIEMIKVAEHLDIIHGYHATIGDGIRNFRNLIHPNLVLRQQIKPNQSIAEIGKGIIVAVLQERLKIE